MEGGGRSLIEDCPSTCLEILSKPRKTLGTLTSNHVEIRSEQLPNTKQQRYRYISLLGLLNVEVAGT
jgi:hypothetical protein